MLSNFSLKVLRDLVKQFNLVSSIKASSRMKKDQLVKELNKHLQFDWKTNSVTTKDREIIFQLEPSKKQEKLNQTYKFFEQETKRQEAKKQERKRA